VEKNDERIVVRGFAVVHRDEDRVAIWQVGFGDRQAKSVNAVVLDLEESGAAKALDSLTWRQILTVTEGTVLPAGVEGPVHQVSAVCEAFVEEATAIGTWADLPPPQGPGELRSDSAAHTAVAAADQLAAAWNFWIRSARKATRPNDPTPPALPAGVLSLVGLNGSLQLVGEG